MYSFNILKNMWYCKFVDNPILAHVFYWSPLKLYTVTYTALYWVEKNVSLLVDPGIQNKTCLVLYCVAVFWFSSYHGIIIGLYLDFQLEQIRIAPFKKRRVWRYQRGNQNPYIEEQTTQWPKEKVQKDKQRFTKW